MSWLAVMSAGTVLPGVISCTRGLGAASIDTSVFLVSWRWNEALQAKATAQEELNRQRQEQGLALTDEQKGQLLALAKDLPRLWKSPSTSTQDRKRMLRLFIKDITVEQVRPERKALLHIRWQGGAVENLGVALPLPAPDKVRYPQPMVERVRTLALTMTDPQIIATLNQEHLLSATGKPFSLSMIKWIRGRHGIPAPALKRTDELTVREAAEHFGVSIGVVYYWIERRVVEARQLDGRGPWWITFNATKDAELREWIRNSGHLQAHHSDTQL